jgi:hypothetical protein
MTVTFIRIYITEIHARTLDVMYQTFVWRADMRSLDFMYSICYSGSVEAKI